MAQLVVPISWREPRFDLVSSGRSGVTSDRAIIFSRTSPR
jgi:hypothetical protein